MLEVSTGSRLHFGLLELAAGEPLRFGGLGLMLEEPGWVLRFAGADSGQELPAPTAPDIRSRIEQVRERLRLQTGHACSVQVEVLRALPMHAGLGAGTQLAAAAAWGISLCAGLTARPSVDELVQWSGRGKRSGIGIYGFLHGGLVLDEGHALPVPQGPMQGPCQGGSSSVSQGPRQLNAASSPLYTAWRVVLVTPDRSTEVTGGYEVSLIERLGQASNPNRDRMHARARRVLELAGSAGGFFEFTGALQEYVDAAGELFAAEQGGMYNGDPVQQAVYLAKQSGLRAVGQSSWGPTVFGFAESEIQAERIASQLLDGRPNERWQIRICTPARQGASWRWIQE